MTPTGFSLSLLLLGRVGEEECLDVEGSEKVLGKAENMSSKGVQKKGER